MRIVIKAQSTVRTKNGDGRLRISINGEYREIRAVVFSKSQKDVLMQAADNAHVITTGCSTNKQHTTKEEAHETR